MSSGWKNWWKGEGKKKLTLSAKVASYASNDAEGDGSPRGNEAGSRSGSNKTRNTTGAPADHGPLLSQTEIEETPSHSGEHGGQAGVPAGHGSTKVSTEGGATVEAEPAEPEEASSEGDEGDVVRTEVHHHVLVAATEDPGVSESRKTGADLDGAATSVVENTPLEGPAVGAPDPEGKGAVDESKPEKDEDHGGEDATPLSDGTNNEGGSDGGEHHLVEGVEEAGDEGGALGRGSEDFSKAEVGEVADVRVAGFDREGERVAPEVPLEDDDGEGHHCYP